MGTVVAGFRVDSSIGESDMAVVYLAEEVATGTRVALKLLTPRLARDERFRQRFLREARLASSLDHPSVVPTIAFGEDESGDLYLAMAFVDGCDLRELLDREGPLEPDRAIALIAQAAAALDDAHEEGLVHRDVKPGNILVRREPDGEHAYVCDFGLARHVSSVSSLTTDSGFVGTIDYVPPEQIEGGRIDRRADVYSLACVLYECLTGARPYERESELAVVFAHLNEPPPSATELRPELPKAFDDLFRTALAKAPADRFDTCGQLAGAARAALQGESAGSGRRGGRRLLVGAAVLAAAAAAAIAGVLATEDSPASHRTGAPGTAPQITQHAIAGVPLGRGPLFYEHELKRKFGGWRPSVLGKPANYPTLSFQQPAFAVYFPARGKPAHIITTWNKDFRTADGLGPCSTLARMHKVYGSRIKPTWAGTSPDGSIHRSWALGRNLLFVTQDRRTISSVVLYRGLAVEKHGGSPQDWANFVGAVETACK